MFDFEAMIFGDLLRREPIGLRAPTDLVADKPMLQPPGQAVLVTRFAQPVCTSKLKAVFAMSRASVL